MSVNPRIRSYRACVSLVSPCCHVQSVRSQDESESVPSMQGHVPSAIRRGHLESPVKERDANEEGPAYAGPSMVNQRFQRPIMSFWALLPEAF